MYECLRDCPALSEYHQGAPKVRNKALQLMVEELETRLRRVAR